MSNKKLNFIRYKILKICFDTKEGHLGSSFSILELAYVIFNKFIKKNYFIISKGHASLGVYAIMQNFKYIKEKDYNSFCKFNSKLGGHPDSTKLPILSFSTGSLGHGLPNSAGFAYGLNFNKSKKKVICLMGDQELMEGTTWETLHIIENFKIKNLLLIIDRNNSDFRSIKVINLKKKLLFYCDKIYQIDGHNLQEIDKTINKCLKSKLFNIIIANTVKGRGIKSMENNPEWHHKVPSSEELIKFKSELNL